MYDPRDDPALAAARYRRAEAMIELERAIDEAFASWDRLDRRLAAFDGQARTVRVRLRERGYMRDESGLRMPPLPPAQPQPARAAAADRRTRRVAVGGAT